MSDYGVEVLAFGPHPDDVELFCGGVMIRMADLGHRTGVVDLTFGERASHGTREERAAETEAASAVLGLGFRENLGLPDAYIDPSSGYERQAKDSQLARAVEVIRRRRPELVLVPWREDRHPDHAAASELLTRAVFFAGVRKFETEPASERFVPRQLLYYELRHRMDPTLVVDTSLAAERKRQAILCYRSQVTRRPGEDPTLISSSGAIDAIDARDRYWGSTLGVSHGEALRAPGVLGVCDPLRHYRDNPFEGAHAFGSSR